MNCSAQTTFEHVRIMSHQERTSPWQQLIRKTLHAAGHRCLDGGEIAPERAWLGRDHLDPNNEDGRDHDEDNGSVWRMPNPPVVQPCA